MAGLLIRGLHLSAAKRLRATAGECHMAPRWLRDRIGPFPRKTGTAMRKTLPAVALLTLALAARQPQAPSTPATDGSPQDAATAPATEADAAFAALSKEWLDGWLRLNPVYATQVGDHSHDDRIDDLGAEGRKATVDFNKAILARLDAIDTAALSRQNQVDALILHNQVEGDIWNVETLQSWAWDPQAYNGLAGGAIYGLMAREFAPMPERLKSATARMQQIPALFAHIRHNPPPHSASDP